MGFNNVNINVSGPAKGNNKHVGTTEERPSFDNIRTGFQFFDTTLGKPIWYNGTTWIDATGVAVDTAIYGVFVNKPTVSSNNIPVGFKYFCTDRQTVEGSTDGIEIIHKGDDVWIDALGRVVN